MSPMMHGNRSLTPVREYRTKSQKKNKIVRGIYKEDAPGTIFPRKLTELHWDVEANPSKKCRHQCPAEI
jgi:hypothetical protein